MASLGKIKRNQKREEELLELLAKTGSIRVSALRNLPELEQLTPEQLTRTIHRLKKHGDLLAEGNKNNEILKLSPPAKGFYAATAK